MIKERRGVGALIHERLTQSHPNLKQVLNIVGIDDVSALYVEGHEMEPQRANEIINTDMRKAKKLAATF
ncbi:hypothetical protein [Peribacillus muralis]|nr:hypothetical protein [Peribacillus muralis]